MHDVRLGTSGAYGAQQLQGAGHVGAEALVDGRVEAHLSGAVDDEVEVVGQGAQADAELALDDPDAVAEPAVDDVVAHPGAERTERVLGQQVPGALLGALPRPGAHDQGDPGVGQVPEHPLEEGLADEARPTGQQQVLPRKTLGEPHGRTLVNVARRRAGAWGWAGALSPPSADSVMVAAQPRRTPGPNEGMTP